MASFNGEMRPPPAPLEHLSSRTAVANHPTADANAPPAVSGRLASLDGWRGVSIILVLVSHAVFTAGFPYPNLGYVGIIFDGELGVRTFFILSGFIITHLLLREARHHEGISLRRFYARRALRILPPYFAFLAVLAALAFAGWYRDAASSWIGSVTFTRNVLGRGDSATVHCWSLAVEEQFYLLWPVLFAVCKLWRPSRILWPLLAVSASIAVAVRLELFTGNGVLLERILGPRSLVRYLDSLAVGCAMAFIYNSCRNGFPRQLAKATPNVLIAIVIGSQLLQRNFPQPLIHSLVPLLQALALGALILRSLRPDSGWIFRVLNHRALIALGALSYSLYLWHFLFLSHFMGPRWQQMPTHWWTTWWIGAFAFSFTSYRCLEQPLMRLRHAFRRI